MHKTQSHTHENPCTKQTKITEKFGCFSLYTHSDCLIVVLSIHPFFGWQSFIFIVMFCGSCAKQIKRARCLSREREYTAFSFIVVFDLYNTQLASWGSLFIMAIIKIIITCSTYTHTRLLGSRTLFSLTMDETRRKQNMTRVMQSRSYR